MVAIGNLFTWLLNTTPGRWVLAFVGFLLAFKAVQWKARMDGEKAANDKRDKEAAEVHAEVVTNITENTNAVIREADAVRAPDAVSVELPDGTKTLPNYHFRD